MRIAVPTCVLVCFFAQTLASAAPPKLEFLFPAGAKRKTTVEVQASGTFKSWPVQVWTDNEDVEFKPSKKRGVLIAKVAVDAIPGRCLMRLYDESGASELRPFLIGLLPEIAEDEPNNDPKKPQSITESATVNGRLQTRGDVDAFAVTLRKGQKLVAAIEANRTLKSPMDGVLQIVSPKGFVLQQNDDFRGMDPQLVFEAPADGVYLVRTFAFPETPNSTIAFAGAPTFVYRLTLTTGGFVDHPWPLAVSRSNPTDIQASGWNIVKGERLILAAKEESDFAVVFSEKLANAKLVRIESRTTLIESDQSTSKKPQSVILPVTISGRIGRDAESDVYEFAVKKGQNLAVTIDAQSIDSPLDPVLRLIDGKGKLLKEAKSRKLDVDPTLTYAVRADTTYRVEVGDFHHYGGPRYVYRLRLAVAEPDFRIKVKTDRYALKPGQSLDIPITIERSGGFKEPIDISAEGLPAGITAETVQASTKAKSIKLKLTGGTGAAVSGPFSIIGRAGKSLQRVASVPVATINEPTSHLWITMSKTAEASKSK